VYDGLLQSKTREGKESIRELEQWVRVTGRRAYPEVHDSDALNRLLKRNFIDALHIEEQRVYVKNAEPANLSEAARAAIRWESVNKSEQMRKQLRGSKHPVRVQIQATNLESEESDARVAQNKTRGQKQAKQAASVTESAGLTAGDVKRAVEEVLQAKGLSGELRPPPPLIAVTRTPGPSWSQPRPSGCFHCHDLGHMVKDCPLAPKCYNCCRRGHMASMCRWPCWCENCETEGHHTTRECLPRSRWPDVKLGQGNLEGSSRSGQTGKPVTGGQVGPCAPRTALATHEKSFCWLSAVCSRQIHLVLIAS
jgi:hypothetical protein